tara:strand:+ start:287 stop:529 length:243 start_codon:yes stop_codon:yes gene_type:complete
MRKSIYHPKDTFNYDKLTRSQIERLEDLHYRQTHGMKKENNNIDHLRSLLKNKAITKEQYSFRKKAQELNISTWQLKEKF